MSVTVYPLDASSHSINVSEIPEKCPFCGLVSDFSLNCIKHYKYSDNSNKGFIDLIFRCQSSKCKNLFHYTYEAINIGGYTENRLRYKSEIFIDIQSFPESIIGISPIFIEIYRQSMIAEGNNLNEIAGLGFRKAFEFLVKDYIISGLSDENEIEEVKSQFKIQILINKYFENNIYIKQISSRISWLGNDEAHYIKKHVNHDVKDMKTLIHLLSNHIDNEVTTKKYLEEITPKK